MCDLHRDLQCLHVYVLALLNVYRSYLFGPSDISTSLKIMHYTHTCFTSHIHASHFHIKQKSVNLRQVTTLNFVRSPNLVNTFKNFLVNTFIYYLVNSTAELLQVENFAVNLSS